MARIRHLTNAPITEALIDLRIATDQPIDRATLEALKPELIQQYPIREVRRMYRAQFGVKDGEPIPPEFHEGFGGIMFKAEDGTRVAQFRPDGFAFNQLKAYDTGAALIAEALRLWDLYRHLAEPIQVTRIAMRYINSLQLPYRHGDDLRRFLTAAPEAPEGAPQTVSNFLTRVVVHEEPDTAIITQKLELAIDRRTPVTLDIDAYRQGQFGTAREDIEGVLATLRDLKNRIFFALLTEEAVGLYA